MNIFNLPNPSGALGLGVHSTSKGNKYEKKKNNISGE
jgi:hypothetical protein